MCRKLLKALRFALNVYYACCGEFEYPHCNDVIMGAIASQNTSLTIVFSAVYLDTDQRKHESSASLAFVRGIHRLPVNSPHKWPVTRKMFPFDDVIMIWFARLALLLNSLFHIVLFKDACNVSKIWFWNKTGISSTLNYWVKYYLRHACMRNEGTDTHK